MNSLLRLVTLPLAGAAVLALGGCQEYFGTNDGYEEGGSPWSVGGDVAGSADFEIVGATPSEVAPGETVEVVLVSESGTPVDSFDVDSFWFCTFDGESAMLETGGNEYEADVDPTLFADNEDIDLSTQDLGSSTISTVTLTVPGGTVTGESLMFDPSGAIQYFDLTIR